MSFVSMFSFCLHAILPSVVSCCAITADQGYTVILAHKLSFPTLFLYSLDQQIKKKTKPSARIYRLLFGLFLCTGWTLEHELTITVIADWWWLLWSGLAIGANGALFCALFGCTGAHYV